MIILIIVTISIDFLLSYFIPTTFNNLNLFYPMLTLTLIVFLFDKVKSKNYLKITFLIGFIYDIVFSYIFLFHSLIFFLFGKLIKKIDKYVKCNFVVKIVLVIMFIFLYDLILYFLVLISRYNQVTFKDLIYKVQNSLVLNISFLLLLTIIFKNKDFKGKTKSYKLKNKLN